MSQSISIRIEGIDIRYTWKAHVISKWTQQNGWIRSIAKHTMFNLIHTDYYSLRQERSTARSNKSMSLLHQQVRNILHQDYISLHAWMQFSLKSYSLDDLCGQSHELERRSKTDQIISHDNTVWVNDKTAHLLIKVLKTLRKNIKRWSNVIPVRLIFYPKSSWLIINK